MEVQASDEFDIHCINCIESVGPIYIECAECTKTKVFMCLQCFAGGAECGSHKRSHNYRVRTSGGVSIFTGAPSVQAVRGRSASSDTNLDDEAASRSSAGPSASSSSGQLSTLLAPTYIHPWCATEEVRLLEAVERYNLGNFEDVAKCVNSRRTVADVKEHYDKYYLRGRLSQYCSRGFVRPQIVDETTEYSAHSHAGASHNMTWFSPPIKDALRVSQDDLRLLAYMPYRDDFEKEYRNDAEAIVSKLLLAPDDDQLDRDVKMNIVDMYVQVVRERRRMKALARDYDLVKEFFKQEKPAKSSGGYMQNPMVARRIKLEKELRDSMRKYAQLVNAEEFEKLIQGLIKEQRLKERIEELQGYQKQGITTLEGKRKWNEAGETPRKRRRAFKRLADPNRKAHLRWERLKRWQKKLVDGLPPTK